MECDVVELKFKGERRELFENPEGLQFKVGDHAIVEADKGIDIGRVNHISALLQVKTGETNLKRIVRKPTIEDFSRHEANRDDEVDALKKCKDKINEHGLPMRLVDCEYQLDKNRVTFHFTADGRIDFRALVRDVAKIFRTRIEFRQIGARDEARRLGGYGVCGQKLCCATWIRDFQPVTTQAAKDQNLALNPTKLAGICGRLKCCLIYERDFYNEAIKQFPELARTIHTEKGEGVVSSIDVFNETVEIKFEGQLSETYSLDYVMERIHHCEHGCSPAPAHIEPLQEETE